MLFTFYIQNISILLTYCISNTIKMLIIRQCKILIKIYIFDLPVEGRGGRLAEPPASLRTGIAINPPIHSQRS